MGEAVRGVVFSSSGVWVAWSFALVFGGLFAGVVVSGQYAGPAQSNSASIWWFGGFVYVNLTVVYHM